MALFNHSTREVTAKIVYYGPALCGKTTNLKVLHDRLEKGTVGRLLSLATAQDRTIYFDLLPLELGNIKGYTVRFQLCTVPGQVHYNETRKIVLKGVDGIVFVVDSQWSVLAPNQESFQNLKENLKDQGTSLDAIPLVIQYNKRDIPGVLPVEALQSALHFQELPFVEAVATEGQGVVETYKRISKLAFADLIKRLQKPIVGDADHLRPLARPQVPLVPPAPVPEALTVPPSEAAKLLRKAGPGLEDSSWYRLFNAKTAGGQTPSSPGVPSPFAAPRDPFAEIASSVGAGTPAKPTPPLSLAFPTESPAPATTPSTPTRSEPPNTNPVEAQPVTIPAPPAAPAPSASETPFPMSGIWPMPPKGEIFGDFPAPSAPKPPPPPEPLAASPPIGPANVIPGPAPEERGDRATLNAEALRKLAAELSEHVRQDLRQGLLTDFRQEWREEFRAFSMDRKADREHADSLFGRIREDVLSLKESIKARGEEDRGSNLADFRSEAASQFAAITSTTERLEVGIGTLAGGLSEAVKTQLSVESAVSAIQKDLESVADRLAATPSTAPHEELLAAIASLRDAITKVAAEAVTARARREAAEASLLERIALLDGSFTSLATELRERGERLEDRVASAEARTARLKEAVQKALE